MGIPENTAHHFDRLGDRMAGLVQVAGVIDAIEARMLVSAGADLLGFPLRAPIEDLTEDDARGIVAELPGQCQGVLITYLQDAAGIEALCGRLGVGWVQIHGDITLDELAALRALNPSLVVIKSLIVYKGNLAELRRDVEQTADLVDGFITDTFDPRTGARGATGLTHDWDVSQQLVRASPKPVILAGGLSADNVGTAIRHVRPAGVDAHRRLEQPDGRKDHALTQAFVQRARAEFAVLDSGTRP